MSHSPDCPGRADYTVGWICALRVEYTAAQVFLDVKYPKPDSAGNSPGDDNHYTHGSVAGHNVVIAVLPGGDYGTASAANVATNLSRSYPNVRIGLMVGIGGGAPTSDRDIRLGDIVVSEPGNARSGVLQYDFGKLVQGGDYQYTKVLNKPPVVLRTALTGLKSRYEINGHSLDQAVEDILSKNRRLRKTYGRPSSDILLKSHVLRSGSCQEADCSREEENLVERDMRDEEDSILVHYGLVATGNSVMQDATLRDEFARRERVLCFEMEAGGLMDTLPCLVIRGICDYSDSHKNKQWQGYAAMVAAAFAKDLLGEVEPSAVQSEWQLSETLKTIADTAIETHVQVAAYLNRKATVNYLDWLSLENPGAYHSDILKNRSPYTGQWFLQSSEYELWRSRKHQTLFCPGIPGAGKTMIMAIVIDDLVSRYHDHNDVAIAWIYYDFRRRGSQGLEQILGSLLRQLTSRCLAVPECIMVLHEKHEQFKTQPSYTELMEVLDDILASFSHVYIVIDALDECLVEGDQRTLPGALSKLQGNARVSLIATSRHIPDIKASFSGQPSLEISAAPKDLAAYLEDKLHQFPMSIQADTELHREIQSHLISTCQGMFLLMKLYMDSLCDKTSKREIRDALRSLVRLDTNGECRERQLPAVLNAAYSDVLVRVQAQPQGHRNLAVRVLAWLTFAKPPLSLDTLQAAVCTVIGDSVFDMENLRDIHTLVSLCCGLVTLDETSKSVRLAHYTTQSYLEEYKAHWAPMAHKDIAEGCIAHLMYDPCHISQISSRYPMAILYGYSAVHWTYHYAQRESEVEGLTKFLQSEAKVNDAMVYSIHIHERERRLPENVKFKNSQDPHQPLVVRSAFTALHQVAYFGLDELVDEAIQTAAEIIGSAGVFIGVSSIDGPWINCFSPLDLASLAGNASITEKLVDAGFDRTAGIRH